MICHPARSLPTLGLIIVLAACSHRQSEQTATAPEPSPVAKPNTVRTDEQARSNPRTLEQILAGRISGVTVSPGPHGGIIVRMAGAQSFYGGSEPLYIIDGAPTSVTGGELSFLNPSDVESITAVKGPDAAIYGVRGANGVIVIKTKGSH